ncbi:unnamed protein product [Camellia sinensis]
MEGLTSDILAMNEREKGVASLGLALVEVAQELNRMKASMSGVDREDLIPCDLIQEETSTLTASALNLLQSRWSDIVEMEGSEARNLVSKLDALPMAGSVHSHRVGGGMADSKVYTPIGGRSGSGGRGGRGGRGQNPVALNPELNVVSAVDNATPDKSWGSISDLSRSVFLGLVDVMVVNPPYVPTPEDVVGREGIASAWAGGENGWSVIDKILPIADKLLSDRGWLYMVTLTANNPSEICLQMREKGYASRIVVQRSTEEESLHVIKFWRDFDSQPVGNEMGTVNKIVPAGVIESLLSQVPGLSFWRYGNSNSRWILKSVNLCERDTEMPRKLMRILKKLREEDPAYYQLCHLVRHSEQPREGFFWSCSIFEHVVRTNGEIRSVDEATLDHQRLLDRLQLYELVEFMVHGDGNCQSDNGSQASNTKQFGMQALGEGEKFGLPDILKSKHEENEAYISELETRQAFTPEQINEACYVDINSNKAVFDSLRNYPKVNYDGRCFAYKSKHALKDKNQLLILIRKFPEGIAVIDLKDAYPTVMEDLQALKAAGQIWLLSNFDSQEDIAYPNDPRVPIKVDDDLKLLFRGIELPRDMIDIEKDLQKNGMKPATNTAKI